MIIGFDTHDLGDALAGHLLRHDQNETLRVRTFGLPATELHLAIRQLRALAMGCRTNKPGVHAFISPSFHYSAAEWARAWEVFETTTGLAGMPYIEVLHLKAGKGGRTAPHVHRAYLRLTVDGKAIRMNHCAPKAEKISRILEVEHGERLISGRFNRAVIDALRADGRGDVADAMVAAGLHTADRPEATSARERAQTERLQDLAADEVKRRAYLAWSGASDAATFEWRLREAGLFVCRGDNGKAMVVTRRGAAYRLSAAVASGAKSCGLKGHVKARDVHALAEQLQLRSIAEVRAALPTAPAVGGWASITGAERSIPHADRELDAAEGDVPPMVAEPVTGKDEFTSPVAAAVAHGHDLETPHIARGEKREADMSVPAAQISVAKSLSPQAMAAGRAFIDALLGIEEPPPLVPEVSDFVPGHPELEGPEMPSWVPPASLLPPRPLWDAMKPVVAIDGLTSAETFKADLAAVEIECGRLIRWVTPIDSGSCRIFLKSGGLLRPAEKHISSTVQSQDAVHVMLSYVTNNNIDKVRIRGGTVAFRERVARMAARRGIVLTNEELQGIIADELEHIEVEQAVEVWKALAAAPTGVRQELSQGNSRLDLDKLTSLLPAIRRRDPQLAEEIRRDLERQDFREPEPARRTLSPP